MERTIEIIKTEVIDTEKIAKACWTEIPDLTCFVADYTGFEPDEVKNFDDIVLEVKDYIIDYFNKVYE